ncbi:MAG: hypothetical protein J7619_01635 [Dyadobacter sp.]|uniref:sensor histidine kinase n=1 Tax=Dyadobacter sp. TaxID=1914288 RepID=UPI001B05DB59|nr:ATP-binding protein [Dyadobacter sp.]MBO9611362.1 hypothetical protein [Dyadobacter sp.]
MKIHFLLPFFFFFTQVRTDSFGLTGNTIEHYTADNGLPQNSVKGISTDAQGFIWLATEDGLVRFDGRSFFVFNSSNLNVKTNRVAEIQTHSRHGTLRENRSPGHERARVMYAKFGLHDRVRIENGRATFDSTYRYEKETKIFSNTFLVTRLPAFGEANRLMVTDGTGAGNFYICDKTYAEYYKNWKKQYKIENPVSDQWNYFSIGGRLYYFHQHKSFTSIFEKRTSKFPLAGDILRNPAYKNGKSDMKLYWNPNSDQAFLFLAGNLYLLEQQKDGRLITLLLTEDFDLKDKEIDIIHFDKISRKIYLGSLTYGLYVLSKRQFTALTVTGEKRPNVFYAQLPYQHNTVLTPTGIIVGKDSLTNRVIDKRLPILEKINPFIDRRIIIRDSDGKIWVKSEKKLTQLSQNGKKIVGQWKFKDEIKAICQGKDAKIWVGVIRNGVYQMDSKNPHSVPRFFGTDSLKDITYIESLTKQQLLVGTATGLFRLDLTTQKPRLVPGTEGVYIKSIHVVSPQRVWITAQTKGLMLLDGKNGLVTFPLDKNKYLASAHCVVSDDRGYLWVPSNRGLFQIRLNDLLQYANRITTESQDVKLRGQTKPLPELFYMYHTMEEGFNTNEFNGNCQPCGMKLPNGYISLPSLNGLVWFRSEQISRYIPDGNLTLDRIEINRQPAKVSGDTIRFPLNPENIKIYFSTAYFGNDYNLNLSYTLVKQDSYTRQWDWLPIDNRDFIVRYSSLSAGNYTLIVRKQNGFGIDNFDYKKVYIIVPYKWYERSWAIGLFLLSITMLLVVGIYFYNVYRLKAIKRKNAELEATILSRTKSLETAVSELRQSKNQLNHQVHIMSRLVASITHDVQSPLKYITFASGHISKMAKRHEFDQISEVGTMISDLSQRTGNMLRDLLDYIKIQVYGKTVIPEEIYLRALIDSKLEIFDSPGALKRVQFLNEVPDRVRITVDYNLLSIVIHNLLDNAVKYSEQGQIRIHVADNPDKTELVISNHGNPLAQGILDLINSAFDVNELDHHFYNGRTTGLGLIIVKEVTRLIGIEIKATQTDVTSFHLFLNP